MPNFATLYRGFSLLELLITLVLIITLANFALPIYTNQIIKVRRTDGIISLLELENKMEQYYAENHTYIGANIQTILGSTISKKGYYRLNLENLSMTTFKITAQPTGPQAKEDLACGVLSINELGQKFITGSGKVDKCWS